MTNKLVINDVFVGLSNEQRLICLSLSSLFHKYYNDPTRAGLTHMLLRKNELIQGDTFFTTESEKFGNKSPVEYIEDLVKATITKTNNTPTTQQFEQRPVIVPPDQHIATKKMFIKRPPAKTSSDKLEIKKEIREITSTLGLREELLLQGIHFIANLEELNVLLNSDVSLVTEIHLSHQSVINKRQILKILGRFPNLTTLSIVPSHQNTYNRSARDEVESFLVSQGRKVNIVFKRVKETPFYSEAINHSNKFKRAFLAKQQTFYEAIRNGNNEVVKFLINDITLPYYNITELYLKKEVAESANGDFSDVKIIDFKPISQIAEENEIATATANYFIRVFLYICGFEDDSPKIKIAANGLIKRVEKKIESTRLKQEAINNRNTFAINHPITKEVILPPENLPTEKFPMWQLLMSNQDVLRKLQEKRKQSDFLTLCHRYGLTVFGNIGQEDIYYGVLTQAAIADALVNNKMDDIQHITPEGVRMKEQRMLTIASAMIEEMHTNSES